MIKAFIFDFAGVIVTDGYMTWLREVDPNFGENLEYYQKISNEVDSVKISNQEFVNKIAEKLKVPPDTIWPEISKKFHINNELLKLIIKLKNKYRVGLLTNFTFEWFDELFSRYNLSRYFDSVVVSSRYKFIKPNPESYKKILELMGVDKKEVIFIDDRQKNVDGGNNFGIKSILYKTNEELLQDFRRLGIEIN